MKYIIISFKSRNELYSFARLLKSNNIFVSIINTPKLVGSSCTLSIKTNFSNFSLVNQYLLRYQPKSFLGIYSVQQANNGEQILKLL